MTQSTMQGPFGVQQARKPYLSSYGVRKEKYNSRRLALRKAHPRIIRLPTRAQQRVSHFPAAQQTLTTKISPSSSSGTAQHTLRAQSVCMQPH